MSDSKQLPLGFNPGENPKERPDLWTTFVLVCENEVVTFFQFANSVASGEIAAIRSGVQFVEVPSDQPIPAKFSTWNGISFIPPEN